MLIWWQMPEKCALRPFQEGEALTVALHLHRRIRLRRSGLGGNIDSKGVVDDEVGLHGAAERPTRKATPGRLVL
jgi:hypothetical protein